MLTINTHKTYVTIVRGTLSTLALTLNYQVGV